MADDEDNEETTDETTDEATDESQAESGNEAEEAAANDDPEFGVKDDEPANDVQMKYLEPLADEQGEDLPDDMSEADAANKINEMQENAAS
jgi:hypothetical protein